MQTEASTGCGPKAAIGLMVVVVLGAWYWWQRERPPRNDLPPRVMPTPNAFDQLKLAKARMVFATKRPSYGVGPPAVGTSEPSIDTVELTNLTSMLGIRRAELEANSQAFALAREALGMEYAQPDLLGAGAGLPSVGRAMLRYEAAVRAADGDVAGALATCLDVLELGLGAERGGAFEGWSAARDAARVAATLAPRLSRSECAAASGRLGRLLESRPALAETWALQTRADLEMWLALMTDPQGAGVYEGDWRMATSGFDSCLLGSGSRGASTAQRLVLFAQLMIISKQQAFDNCREYYDRCAGLAALPYDPRRQRVPVPFPNPANLDADGPFEGHAKSYHRITVHLVALRAALALRAYALDHARPAPDLAALVPEYLPAAPADPFAPGRPLQYDPSDPSRRLRSVGYDGKPGTDDDLPSARAD